MFDAMGIRVHLCGDRCGRLTAWPTFSWASMSARRAPRASSSASTARSSPRLEPSTAMSVPRPGWAEQDADAVWWADVCAIGQRLVAAVPAGDRIAALAVSAIGPTLLPLDEAGRPLRSGDPLRRRHAGDRPDRGARGAPRGRRLLAAVRPRPLEPGRRAQDRVAPRAGTGEIAAGPLVRDRDHLSRLPPDRRAGHRRAHGVALEPALRPAGDRLERPFADGITDLDRLPRIGWPADQVGDVDAGGGRRDGLPAGIPVAVGTRRRPGRGARASASPSPAT